MREVAVVGVGSISAGPQVLASLANYFGERPISVTLWDGDLERLDLMARLAEVLFSLNKCEYPIRMEPDLKAAVAETKHVIWLPDENCHRKAPNLVEEFALHASPGIDLLCLATELEPSLEAFWRYEWPAPLTEAETREMPLQVLRWIRAEDYPWALLKQFERSPVVSWLDDPFVGDFVSRSAESA